MVRKTTKKTAKKKTKKTAKKKTTKKTAAKRDDKAKKSVDEQPVEPQHKALFNDDDGNVDDLDGSDDPAFFDVVHSALLREALRNPVEHQIKDQESLREKWKSFPELPEKLKLLFDGFGYEPHDTVVKKAVYIQTYLRTGRNDLSCARAEIVYQQPYAWARCDSEFKEAWDRAKEVMAHAIEDAAMKRGIEGVLRPVYHRGALQGFERVYSDSLLAILLKASNPEKYRERTSTRHGGDPDSPPIETNNKHGLDRATANSIRRDLLGIKEK